MNIPNVIIAAFLLLLPASFAAPVLEYVAPTPLDDTRTANASVGINISVMEGNLSELNYEWNAANFTFYNDSLLVFYNFDNRSTLGENGTYVADISSHGISGTVSGNGDEINPAAGRYGAGIDLDGNGDYVTSGGIGSLLDGKSNWSMSLWIYPRAINGNIIGTSAGSGMWIWVGSSYLVGFDSYFTGTDQNTDANALAANQWNHLLITRNVTEFNVYVNGSLFDTLYSSTSVNANVGGNLQIGRFSSGGADSNSRMDDFGLWNRTLSPEEAYQLYVSSLQKFNSTLWQLYVNQASNATSGLMEGTYTHSAYARDRDGNENTTGGREIIIDRTGPLVTLDAPVNGTYSGFNITLQVRSNEAITNWWYSLSNGNTNATFVPNASFTGTEGANQLIIYANDSAGNVNQTAVNFTIDSIIPSITILVPANASFSSTNISLRVNSSEQVGSWFYNLDGSGTRNAFVPNASFTAAQGLNRLFVYANDSANNTGASAVNFTADGIAPQITIASPENRTYGQPNVTLSFTADESTDSSWYSLNGGATNTSFVSGSTFTASGGVNEVYVYANDSLNNTGIANINFTIDAVAPIITINTPANVTYNALPITLNISVNENSTARYSIDGGANVSLAPNATSTGFTSQNDTIQDGTHNVTFYANDTTNNIAIVSVAFTLYTADSDGDGILDSNDTLIGNESSVRSSGLSRINVTVAGNSTNGTFYGTQEVIISDNTDIMVNFTYNFSLASLNLSGVYVSKSSDSLVINISGYSQVNKTVYFNDYGYTELCVKDAIVNSHSDISATCGDANETDFSTCIGVSGGTTINGISCYDEGSKFRFENLRHSGIRGSAVSADDKENYSWTTTWCANTWVCTEWSLCSRDMIQSRACTLKFPKGCIPSREKPEETRECRDVLFAMLLEMDSRLFVQSSLLMNLTLKEMNTKGAAEAIVRYVITDAEGHVIREENDTRTVERELQYWKEISIAAIPLGDYTVTVYVANRTKEFASAGKNFSISETTRPKPADNSHSQKIAGLVSIIILFCFAALLITNKPVSK
ncbi:MAG TPA: LamG domain-containing protein [archaeon]|nr:LamG domain-containing protein [archaeon]